MAKRNNIPTRTSADDDLLSLRNIRAGFSKRLQAISIVFVFVIAASLITYFSVVPGGGPTEADRYRQAVANVNGEPIKREQFELHVSERRREMAALGNDAINLIGLPAMMLDEQIQQMLIAQAARKEGVSVSGRDVDREVDKLVEEQVKRERERAAQGKPLTDRQFEMIIQSSMGKSVNAWRQELKRNWEPRKPLLEQALLEQKLREKVASVPPPSDEQLKNSFDELKIRHILISTGKRTEEQARQRAEEVLQKLRGGADFVSFAKQFSDDQGTKAQGGSLGAIQRSQLSSIFVPEFAKAVETLQQGQLSDLVKTQYGFHIIRVDSVTPRAPQDLDKNKQKYIDEYLQSQREAKWRQYLQQLRQTAKIEVLDPELKAFQTLQDLRAKQGTPEYPAAVNAAIQAFEKATNELPSAEAMVVLGQLYLEQASLPAMAEPARKKARESAITAWQNALQRIESIQLRMMLAELYRQQKQDDLAIKQYEEAGEVAWDRPDVHSRLKQIYKEMGRKDLVKKEEEWEKRYQQRMKTEMVAPPAGSRTPVPPPASESKP